MPLLAADRYACDPRELKMPPTTQFDAHSEPRVYVNQPLPESFGLPSDAVIVANLRGGDPRYRYFAPTLESLERTIATEYVWSPTSEHAGVAFAGLGISRVPVELLNRNPEGRMPGQLKLALSAAFAVHGAWVLHGAAIVGPVGGILVLGNSFAGKSTTAASALLAGYRIVSDDWILLWEKDGGAFCRSLRPFAALRRGAWEALRAQPGFSLGDWRATGARFTMRLDDGETPGAATRCRIDCTLHARVVNNAERPWLSEHVPVQSSEAFASLVRASTPALFVRRLKQSVTKMTSTATVLFRSSSQLAVIFGRRLICEPTSEWLAMATAILPGGDGTGVSRSASHCVDSVDATA